LEFLLFDETRGGGGGGGCENTTRLCLNVNDPSFEYVTGQIINSNTGDGSNVARSKGKQVNFLASSSPKRDVNPVTMSGRTTTQKNFEEYKNANSNKNKTNRQKTYIISNNAADEKENKYLNNGGDRTTDEGFSSSHEDHHQQISLSPGSSQPGYDEYLSYAGLNQKSIGQTSLSSLQPDQTQRLWANSLYLYSRLKLAHNFLHCLCLK
jgi:hypothetical protein